MGSLGCVFTLIVKVDLVLFLDLTCRTFNWTVLMTLVFSKYAIVRCASVLHRFFRSYFWMVRLLLCHILSQT